MKVTLCIPSSDSNDALCLKTTVDVISKEFVLGAGEMTQLLKTLTTLAEDQIPFLATAWRLRIIHNSSSMDPMPLS